MEIREVDCPKCDGNGHKVKDGIKLICKQCSGIGRVCQCHKRALYDCPTKIQQEFEDL